MFPRIVCIVLLSLMTLSSPSWAHPGHGVTPADEPAHWIVEPIHGWPILLAVGVAVLVCRRIRSRA